jgi:hypothetical protein
MALQTHARTRKEGLRRTLKLTAPRGAHRSHVRSTFGAAIPVLYSDLTSRELRVRFAA